MDFKQTVLEHIPFYGVTPLQLVESLEDSGVKVTGDTILPVVGTNQFIWFDVSLEFAKCVTELVLSDAVVVQDISRFKFETLSSTKGTKIKKLENAFFKKNRKFLRPSLLLPNRDVLFSKVSSDDEDDLFSLYDL